MNRLMIRVTGYGIDAKLLPITSKTVDYLKANLEPCPNTALRVIGGTYNTQGDPKFVVNYMQRSASLAAVLNVDVECTTFGELAVNDVFLCSVVDLPEWAYENWWVKRPRQKAVIAVGTERACIVDEHRQVFDRFTPVLKIFDPDQMGQLKRRKTTYY